MTRRIRTWNATLPDGRTVSVEMAHPLTYTGPGPHTREQKRDAIVYGLTRALTPKIGYGTPPEKRLERDESGQIARVIDVPAYSAGHLAATVALRVADAILGEPDE